MALYLVVNGGSQALTNAHLRTLEGERFTPYRGQSYGVDLVRINRVGLRVPGLLPADPAVYFIYGDPVLAPCRGRVVFAEDGAADMPPPRPIVRIWPAITSFSNADRCGLSWGTCNGAVWPCT